MSVNLIKILRRFFNKPLLLLISIGLTLFILLIVIRFVSLEDSWICDGDQWIKHGFPSYPKPIIPCGKKETLPRTKEGCIEAGGVWKKQGPEPFETCNKKTSDRGNLCRDNSECEGVCQANLTRDELSEGMKGKKFHKLGQCSVWKFELGCQGLVENGKVSVICFD